MVNPSAATEEAMKRDNEKRGAKWVQSSKRPLRSPQKIQWNKNRIRILPPSPTFKPKDRDDDRD